MNSIMLKYDDGNHALNCQLCRVDYKKPYSQQQRDTLIENNDNLVSSSWL